MCIIIDNQDGHTIDDEIIDNCIAINSDGFGFYDIESGKVYRTMDMKKAEQVLKSTNRPFVAHCRYATRGNTSIENVHPFNTKNGGLLFHNGTVGSLECSKTNDSRQIANILEHVTDVEAFLSMFDSRFLHIAADGSMIRTGDWEQREGVWYSKDNVFPENFEDYYYSGSYSSYSSNHSKYAATNNYSSLIGVYGTLRKGMGNHDLIKHTTYKGLAYTTEEMRLCVDGLPYLIEGEHPAGYNVELELYEMYQYSLSLVDELEGHPYFYERKKLDCITEDGEFVSPWVYMVGESYDSGLYYPAYLGRGMELLVD